jgi:N-acetylated-alpha-linked acidic dipeptidase
LLQTIVLASWDGEEYGLLGSTAWAEDSTNNVQKNAGTFLFNIVTSPITSIHVVAYLNVDVAVTGPNFGAAATPSLINLLRSVTTLVPSLLVVM